MSYLIIPESQIAATVAVVVGKLQGELSGKLLSASSEIIKEVRDQACGSTRAVSSLKNKKSQIDNLLKGISKKISVFQKTIKAIKVPLKALDAAIIVIKTLPIPQAVPPGFGLPISITTVYSDLLHMLRELVKQIKEIVEGIETVLRTPLNLLESLKSTSSRVDLALEICGVKAALEEEMERTTRDREKYQDPTANSQNFIESLLGTNVSSPLSSNTEGVATGRGQTPTNKEIGELTKGSTDVSKKETTVTGKTSSIVGTSSTSLGGSAGAKAGTSLGSGVAAPTAPSTLAGEKPKTAPVKIVEDSNIPEEEKEETVSVGQIDIGGGNYELGQITSVGGNITKVTKVDSIDPRQILGGEEGVITDEGKFVAGEGGVLTSAGRFVAGDKDLLKNMLSSMGGKEGVLTEDRSFIPGNRYIASKDNFIFKEEAGSLSKVGYLTKEGSVETLEHVDSKIDRNQKGSEIVGVIEQKVGEQTISAGPLQPVPAGSLQIAEAQKSTGTAKKVTSPLFVVNSNTLIDSPDRVSTNIISMAGKTPQTTAGKEGLLLGKSITTIADKSDAEGDTKVIGVNKEGVPIKAKELDKYLKDIAAQNLSTLSTDGITKSDLQKLGLVDEEGNHLLMQLLNSLLDSTQTVNNSLVETDTAIVNTSLGPTKINTNKKEIEGATYIDTASLQERAKGILELSLKRLNSSNLSESTRNNLSTLLDTLKTVGKEEVKEDPKYTYTSPGGVTYFLDIVVDASTSYIAPRRYAVAKDREGVVVMKGPLSFSSSVDILLDELKFRINNQLP